MIKVNLKKSEVIIKGHSNHDDAGKDIVCASVSTAIIVTINALVRLEKKTFDYEEDDGYIRIFIKKSDKETQVLIDNLVCTLKELAEKYEENIKIFEEVQ